MHRHISQRQSSMSAANQRQGRVRTTSAVSACPLLAKGLRQKCEPLSAPRARFASLLERGSTRWALGTAEGGVRKAPVGQIWSALPASGRPVVLLRLTLCLSRGTPRASERSPKGLSDKGRGTPSVVKDVRRLRALLGHQPRLGHNAATCGDSVGSIAHYRLVGGQADAVSREPEGQRALGWGSGNPEAERAGRRARSGRARAGCR